MSKFDDFYNQMNRLNKLVNPAGIAEMQRIQNAIQKTILPQSDYLSQIQKTSELFQSPVINAINKQMEFYSKTLPFGQAINTIEQYGVMKYSFPLTSTFQKQFGDISALIKPISVISTAIEENNVISRAINQLGIFDTIASLSKNMSAIEAMNKLNNIIPKIELFDYNFSFSDDGTVIVDDTTVSRDDISEIAKEFSNSSLENLSISQKFEKIKSKKWYFFVFILWYIFQLLILEPIIDKTLDEIRERMGINKIIEKINIKIWLDEIFPLGKETQEEKVVE